MVYLEHDAFMAELAKLYQQNTSAGSVWVTTKRVERPVCTGRAKLDTDGPVCIVRATDGKQKLACVVSTDHHARFHTDLFSVIRAHTHALQKPKRVSKSAPIKNR